MFSKTDRLNLPAIVIFRLAMFIPCLLLYALSACGYGHRPKVKEAEVKANIHAIQIALERYAVDSGG